MKNNLKFQVPFICIAEKVSSLLGKISVYKYVQLLILLMLVQFVGIHFASAQLSSRHYLPPLKQTTNVVQGQAIYLSTPETTAFDVNVYQGTSTTAIATLSVSNSSPGIYTPPLGTGGSTAGGGDNNTTLVTGANAGVVITSSMTGSSTCAGASVTFTATAIGFTSPTYQWYKNGTAISGANASTYTTSVLVNNDVINVALVEGGASVSTTGLVLNLDAGNSSSYNSGATTWTDLTGRGNHGTLNNVTYSSNSQGYLSFNGTSSYISLPNSNDFNFGTGDFTIELWAQNSSAAKTPNLLAINSNNGFYSSVRIAWAPNINGNPTVTFAHSTNGTSWSVQTGYTGSFSSWTQIVLSRTAGVVTIYANGVNKGTYNLAGSLMTTTTSNPIYNQIGTLPNWQSVYTLLGNMSIVRYYKAAGLTSSQVISNYNAICSRYGLSAIGTTSNSITATVTPGPNAPSITIVGDGCINKTSLTTTSGLTSYTWYKDNVAISEATNNSYNPTAAGDYKVLVSNGTCNATSTPTTITNCGVTADGSMSPILTTLVSNEGGINFGTGINELGSLFNATGLTTTTGTIAATTAVIGGIISATNAVTSSIGVIYSTDANFGTYSSSTIQTNVVAGTYTTTITGLTGLTTYYAKSFIVNKAGTSYGPVVSFTTTTPPVAVGNVYGGGIVFYVLQPGDNGYDANVQHGLIAATQNQVTGGSFANVNNNINNPLYHTTAGSQFTDWRIPTLLEIQRLYSKKYLFGAFDYNKYYIINVPASFTNTSESFYAYDMDNGNSGTGFGYPCNLRAIRSF